MDNIVRAIREYLKDCPALDEFSKIGVDYLGTEPTEYNIESVPADPILKKYMDGGSFRQYVFVFASKEYYGSDVWQNLENLGFYEKLSAWFEEQTRSRNLPDLGPGKTAESIEALTSGYIFDTTEDQARYQLQARITYLQL